jgi:hypothetical protein
MEVFSFLRKVANDIADDYKILGANGELIREFKTYVHKLSDEDLELGFQSFHRTKGKFLFGRIPLHYIMLDESLRVKYKQLFTSYDQSFTEEKTQDNPMEAMMNNLNPFGGEIAALTKEVLQEMPSAGQMGPNLNIAALIENVKSKVESKLASGKFDQAKLQEQAQSMVENFGGQEATTNLLSAQLSQLMNMTKQMNSTPIVKSIQEKKKKKR